MNVPQGQSKIARRFNGGLPSPNRLKSRRDGRNQSSHCRMICRPSGTWNIWGFNPALKCRAIIFRLCEACLTNPP